MMIIYSVFFDMLNCVATYLTLMWIEQSAHWNCIIWLKTICDMTWFKIKSIALLISVDESVCVVIAHWKGILSADVKKCHEDCWSVFIKCNHFRISFFCKTLSVNTESQQCWAECLKSHLTLSSLMLSLVFTLIH